MYKPIIAITAGDPAGVGCEISIKSLTQNAVYEKCRPFLVGDKAALEMPVYTDLMKGFKFNFVRDVANMRFQHGYIDVYDMGLLTGAPKLGEIAAEHGAAAFGYVDEAIRLAMLKVVDATVTAPISKEALKMAGINFPGHTEIYATKTGTANFAMMLAHEHFRVIHVSTHVSLRQACDLVKKERVVEVIQAANETCLNLGIVNPRVAVAGLNPHAGENGMFGVEEIEEIIPAINLAKGQGINAIGPIPPDTVFPKLNAAQYDICVCMYHDQGHIPTKLLGFDFNKENIDISGINMTVGLPVVRVSVDHGTAFDIAGKGLASADSLLSAIEYATAFSVKRFCSRPGAAAEIHKIVEELKPHSVCVVTDDNVMKNATVADIIQKLNAKTVKINSEPTFGMLKQYMTPEIMACDMLVAIGGGSVIDVAKLLAVATANPAFVENPYDASLIQRKGAYFAAIPTTAGTGAEATPNSIMLDEETGGKIGIVNKLTIADAVLLDANLTLSMPRALTLTTGLDALAHAVESLFSKKANVYSNFYAQEAIRLIIANLEKAADGNIVAHEKMLLASHYAGICLTSSSTCAIHAIAYPLSRFKVSHGAGVSMLFAPIMRLFSENCDNFNVLGEGFMIWLEGITAQLNLSPVKYGITPADFPQFAKEAHAIRRLMDNNPFDMSVGDIEKVYGEIL